MNVILSNKQKTLLDTLDCDIIKHISGEYSSKEIVDMFKDFFFNKLIIDITALKENKNLQTYEELIKTLDPSKIIFFLPEKSELCTSSFLSNLISLGIYNFTPSVKGVNYLLKNSNTYDDVKKIAEMSKSKNRTNDKTTNENNDTSTTQMTVKENDSTIILGFKNETDHAGATTLIYILKKALNNIYGKEDVLCIEIDKEDFLNFKENNMISTHEEQLPQTLKKHNNKKIILIDLNGCKDISMCKDVYYLLEPSTIKLSKLLSRNKNILEELKQKKVVLNKSTLDNKDVLDFEKESNLKILYNLPSLNERKMNIIINEFLVKINLLGSASSENNSKVFGLFRK